MRIMPSPRVAYAAVSLVCILGCSPPGSFKITTIPPDQTLKERIVERSPGWVSDRLVIIDISGVLTSEAMPTLFAEGEHPVSLAVEKLAAAAKDHRVKAVVLRINSPGGTVTASDTLYQEIKRFRQETGKPVIAFFQDVAASGAYYLACAADDIIAQRTAITGSIGVIMQMVDLSGTMSKLGITADAIKSGPLKDAGSPLRGMRPEERATFQSIVDALYRQFLDVVSAGRPKLTKDNIRKLADGRIYAAEQALEAGLVDRIGTLKDAIEAAKDRAKIEKAHVVIYHRPHVWKSTIYAETPARQPIAVNLFNINVLNYWTNRPRFMYIWGVDG